MIRPDETVRFELTAEQLNVVFAALQEVPYRASAPVIERLRAQVLQQDPSAFDPPPRINGEAPAPVPN